MPRVVDYEVRRRDIAEVALAILARDGVAGLSLRNIAAEMGGSLTLVTHYYANRQELMTDLACQICDSWQADLDAMDEASSAPRARLRAFLAWMLPLSEKGHQGERARFALLAADNDPDCRSVLIEFDEYLRDLLRQRLVGLVPRRKISTVADLLRALTNGVALDAQLQPDDWPAKRQLALLDALLATLIPE